MMVIGKKFLKKNIDNLSASGVFSDSYSAGTWWYKIKVADDFNNWNESEPLRISEDEICENIVEKYYCERNTDFAELCASSATGKAVVSAVCFKITDSCGELITEKVENSLCGKTCQTKIYNCKTIKNWTEVAP